MIGITRQVLCSIFVAPDKPALTTWALEVFGRDFELVHHEVDIEGIPKTYSAALQLNISVPENRLAYKKLAELGSSADGVRAAIVYVKCFLFQRDNAGSNLLKTHAYQFRVRRNYFSNVLRTKETYGAVLEKWNLILGRSGSGKTTLLKALEGELSDYVTRPMTPT